MKLPDFSTFKPLNENREQMNAELPENLSFVKIPDRLTNADLEKKEVVETVLPPKPKPVAQAKTPSRKASPHLPPAFDITRTMLIIQLVVLFDFILVAGLFYVFGAPWQKHPYTIQNITYQTIAAPAPKPAPVVSKKPAPPKPTPHFHPQTEPFYKRNEYFDQYGVRHTVIEELPYNKGKH